MGDLTFALVGPGGEPVDLARTIDSHGFGGLPPMRQVDGALEVTLPLPGRRPRTVRVHAGGRGRGRNTRHAPAPSAATAAAVLDAARHVLRMDQDLSPFYALAADDPDLAWVARGSGRMLRSPTVFEDVVKTICTTNCTWSATTRMVTALVEHLGEAAPGAPASGPLGRAFPTPAAMAAEGERFYRDVVRAGYRGAYLRDIARRIARDDLDLEALATSQEDDDALRERLLALPGVGPYAAAHILMTLGRHSRLILDSWTRPTYARIAGKRTVADATIERRFRRYGRWAGLAFWLTCTRDWIDD
ncbi:MAG: DNA-3-methyladenine glycosylase family protein [Actinomycetota bacterium]